MSEQFIINDPVEIQQKSSSPPLHGVVAFLGPVSFAEGDDWVGVRLTGDSVGRGKNDGSVKGIQYFDNCGENGGMFVKKGVLTKRKLTRLEELRLKRELKSKCSTSTSASPSTRRLNLSTSGDSTGSGVHAEDDASVSSMTSMRSSATAATNRSRLDEIRSRRLALQQKNSSRMLSTSSPGHGGRGATSTPPTKKESDANITSYPRGGNIHARAGTPTATPLSAKRRIPVTATSTPTPTPTSRRKQTPSLSTIPSSSPKIDTLPVTAETTQSSNKAEIENGHLKTKIEILTSKLKESEEQNTSLQSNIKSLQSNLDICSKESHEFKLEINGLKAKLEQQRKESDDKLAAAMSAAASVKSASQDETLVEIQKLRDEIESLKASNLALSKDSKEEKERIQLKYQVQISSIQESYDQELNQKETELNSMQKTLTSYEGKISLLEKNIAENSEKVALREDHDSVHYKERAKLQAEILTWSRKVQDIAKEKLELEIALEELTLDKESLQEKCEEMEDVVDELKIDAESAQIEVDELRLELESARERAEKAESAITLLKAGSGVNIDGSESTHTVTEEVAQALSIQNARLREAIVRLREQTTFEKMELTKKLRAVEKDSGAVEGLKEEVIKLLRKEKELKAEVNELKEMVDQGSAFEKMVEEMSDRVLEVEDNNIALQSDIRALEEAAELSAEMEEVQADEIRALMKELQVRDTVVINLEEAIKMQRKRELDFQRTVGNYRQSIETLQEEKNSLLALHEGGEGEKKNAFLASQKALAHAAQSVADAALARKREANAIFNLIDAKMKSHLAERIEDFLPQNLASSEIAAVKGELMLSKIAMKSSLSLNTVSEIFQKSVRNAKTTIENIGRSDVLDVTKVSISSNLSQLIGISIHQTKFAQLAIDSSSECLRLLSLSQWPDTMSSDASIDFSISISHSIPQLDTAISELLLKIKEEGVLSPHQSNLNILSQALQNVHLSLDSIIEREHEHLVPTEWNPPSLVVLKNVSKAKFSILGSTSALAAIIDVDEGDIQERCSFISQLFQNLNKLSNEISAAVDILSCVEITNSNLFDSASPDALKLKNITSNLFETVEKTLSAQELSPSALVEVQVKINAANMILGNLLSILRSRKKEGFEEEKTEILSPETSDPWETIKSVIAKVKYASGDTDDINYLIRARKLEEQLTIAVENEAKLSIANTKIRSLEKNLATRSKEVSIQNGRLQELERMLSETAIKNSAMTKPTEIKQSFDESKELKEEVRILNEAMEVLQTQVDEYEEEIKILKDPQKGTSRRGHPGSARKNTPIQNFGSGNVQKSSSQDIKYGLVEAALFRPALRSAKSDASLSKAKSIVDSLMALPPLPKNTSSKNSELSTQRYYLLKASAELRRKKADVSIIDITKDNIAARHSLNEQRRNTALVLEKLKTVSNSIHFNLSSQIIM